jgi:hypothetical protein
MGAFCPPGVTLFSDGVCYNHTKTTHEGNEELWANA